MTIKDITEDIRRKFHSYGPVEAEENFYVPRRNLVDQLVRQLVGRSEKRGHYFTIWAARQTGKTGLMRQAKTEVGQRYRDQFAVYHFSLETMREMDYGSKEKDRDRLPRVLTRILQGRLPNCPILETWEDFRHIFAKEGGL